MHIALSLEQFSCIVYNEEFFSYINDKVQLSLDNINLKTIAHLDEYPRKISNVLLRTESTDATQLLLQDRDDILLRRLSRIFFDQGFMECINVAADLYERSDESRTITLPAFYLRNTLKWFKNLRYKLQPNLKELCSNYSSYYATRNWEESRIRYIAWHPLCTRLAIAALDDTIHVCHCSPNTPPTILRGRNQKSISCLSWRPYAAFELAVGSSIGVILWKIDSNSIQIKPSMTNALILKDSHIDDMTWNNWGTILVTASSFSGSISVWNCEQSKCEKVWCSRAGVNLVKWALNTHYLYTAAIEGIYKVWDTCSWTSTKWSSNGVIQTACWSPCGNHLIFATSNDPKVFTINMNVALGPTKSSTPLMGPTCLVDTTEISLPNGDVCGGLVQNLQISPDGGLLTIMFKCTNYIAVCKMSISCTVLRIYPSFLFCGLPGEQPACMDFQKVCKEGSLLTVGWSSARIQHLPIIQMWE